MESQTHARGGRPSKYKPEFADRLIEFFEDYVREPYTKEIIREDISYYDQDAGGGVKNKRTEYKFVAKRLPTLFGFARQIGVDYDTVHRWSILRVGDAPEKGEVDRRPYRYPEFYGSYKKAVLFQTEFLTAIGLGGIAPPTAYVFTAKNVIRWRDATEQRIVDKDGKDRAMPSYVILPARKTEKESEDEFTEQESDAAAVSVE